MGGHARQGTVFPVMNRFFALPLPYTFGEVSSAVHPVLIQDENEMVIVDCGFPGYFSRIKDAVGALGLDLGRLTRIIITHHDFDHMGAAAELKEACPKVEICASQQETPYIEGTIESLRLQQAQSIQDALPEHEKENGKRLQALFASVKPVKVDRILENHEVLPYCGGIEVVPTPGHTLGHISLYLREFKALVAGDALVLEKGSLGLANPQYAVDLGLAQKSVSELAGYDTDKIACYHGGILDKDASLALRTLASQFTRSN